MFNSKFMINFINIFLYFIFILFVEQSGFEICFVPDKKVEGELEQTNLCLEKRRKSENLHFSCIFKYLWKNKKFNKVAMNNFFRKSVKIIPGVSNYYLHTYLYLSILYLCMYVHGYIHMCVCIRTFYWFFLLAFEMWARKFSHFPYKLKQLARRDDFKAGFFFHCIIKLGKILIWPVLWVDSRQSRVNLTIELYSLVFCQFAEYSKL